MIRGYCKLESDINHTKEKVARLIEAGVTSGNLYYDTTGDKELKRLLGALRKGDTLVVAQTADLCHSQTELADLIERLNNRGIAIHSIREPWLDFGVEETDNPFLSARNNPMQADNDNNENRTAGRPRGPRREIVQKLNFALRMYHTAGHMSVSEICTTAKLNERTFYRHLERLGIQVIRRPKGRKPKEVEEVVDEMVLAEADE